MQPQALSSKRYQEKISDSLFNEGILYRHILPHLLLAEIPVFLEERHLKAVSRVWAKFSSELELERAEIGAEAPIHKKTTGISLLYLVF